MSNVEQKITVKSGEAEPAEPVRGTLAPGAVIDDRYEVLAFIGAGGMGEVYKVSDRGTKAVYALKMIVPALAADKAVAKRLEHEAQAARTLAHGNIVSIYDVGASSSGAPYLIMDYIEGDSLDDVLRRETVLHPMRAVLLFVQIAEALVHAQAKCIVHRDLKPSNILLTKTASGEEIVKIVDFGIAKIADKPGVEKTKLTQTGELLGTPLYMSPEQCRGDELDQRSDVYSFGCIMHEALSGHPTFAAENPVRVILKHLGEEPPPLPKNAGISADLQEVIRRCLEKDPADRYQTAVALLTDLQRVVEGRAISKFKQKRKPLKMNRWIPAAAGALLLCAGSTMLLWQRPQVPVAVAPVATRERPEMYKGRTLKQWTDAIEHSPDDASLYLDRGKLHVYRDERTNAIDDFSQAITLKPDYIAAFTERANMYTMINKYDQALADANKAISLDPENPEAYSTRAFLYQSMEDYGAAIADFKKAISLDGSSNNYYGLGRSLFKAGRFNDALEALSHTDLSEPFYAGMYSLVATSKNDLPLAKKYGEVAISDGGSSEWPEYAAYLVASGNMSQAEQAVAQIRAVDTFPARAYRFSGEVYRIAGLYDKAIHEFDASTSLEDYPPGRRERAQTFMALGEMRDAYNDLKRSLSLNPHSPVTLSYLALVEDSLGMTDDAKTHIEAATKGSLFPPIVYVNRGAIRLNHHDSKGAMEDVNKAISIDPWLKEAYQVRAKIYDALGDAGKAKADRDNAGKLMPHMDF